MSKFTRTAFVLCLMLAWTFPLGAQAQSNKFKYQITPYFWAAGLDGKVGALGRSTDIDESFGSIWNNLKAGGMGTFEGRWNRWVLLVDGMYLDLENDESTPDLGPFTNAAVKSKTLIIDPEFGYQILRRDGAELNALVGGRFWRLKNELQLTDGGGGTLAVEETRNWVDPIVGLQFRGDVSHAVYVTAKADIGGFSTAARLDWQAFGGLGFRFNDRVALIVGYRVLGVDYSKDGFLYDVTMQGVVVGVGIRF